MKRIRRLLYPKSTNRQWVHLFAASILIATPVVALAASPAPSTARQSSAPLQVQRGPAETSAYAKWLNEEVVYIITDEERAAFEKLRTDAERDEFVNQFWERRNPNPGSGENEFKEELYRRIAYANNHFAASRPGWKTDRGHLYIMYGPPNEIDSHLPNKSYAFEVWKYNYIDGVGNDVPFTFVDKTGKGDFELATPLWKSPVKKTSPSA